MLARLQELPELSDVATDQQVQGLRARLVFDRDTAARLGITPSTIDQTLYDAYGQREVSTIFTQLNQYHVVLEVKPAFRQNPIDLRNLFIRTGAGSSASAAGLVAGGSATSAVAQGPGNTSSAATTAANAASAALASSRIGRRRHRVLRGIPHGRPGSAQRLYPRGIHGRPHHREPPGPVSGDHALLQSRARRFAGRCRECGEQGQG